MALSASVLAALMKANIEAITNYPVPGSSPVVVDPRVIQAISAAIVTHITSAGQVEPGTFFVSNAPGAVTGEGTIL